MASLGNWPPPCSMAKRLGSYLILTAYFDESGTHDGSPATVMAGVLGDVSQWGQFRTNLAVLKLRHGFNRFHTVEFKQRKGQFAGWSPERCVALASDLYLLTSGRLMDGVEFVLDNEAYRREYKRGGGDKKLVLDSKYGLCFRQCLSYFIMFIIQLFENNRAKHEISLNVVLEAGHRNAGAAVKIFEEERKQMIGFGINLLGSVTFADKDCDELMMPDFLAHMALHSDRKIRAGHAQRPLQRTSGPIAFRRFDSTSFTHLEFRPGGLADARLSLEKQLETRRSLWKREPTSLSGKEADV